MSRTTVEFCKHSQNNICAIEHRNSGWIRKPHLSASSNCWISVSSSIAFNLWLLAHVSACGYLNSVFLR